jgi:hypothetical protein
MSAPEPPRRAGAALRRIVLVVAVLALLAMPLVLHVTQRRHDRLPFDVTRRFPPDAPLVGGEAFATTVAELVDHELSSGTGWRPNDFVLWGPGVWADNNANRQRGIIRAVRESVRVLKDHLTKVSSDEYDQNLVAADTAFRNDPERLWLPSAESRFRDGVEHLRAYVAGLAATPPASRPVNRRNVELIRLVQAWTDLLGDAHAQLYRTSPGFLRTDDLFYHAQGVTHVLHHLTRAVAREWHGELEARPILRTLFTEVAHALGEAATLKPFVVLDGGPAGIFANHRRNLDAYVTEARQKMYSIREELEK